MSIANQWILALCLFSLTPPCFGFSQCAQVFQIKKLKLTGGRPVYDNRKDEFFVQDSNDDTFIFEATLNSDNQLSIAAFLKEAGERSSLRGSQLYTEMINYFGVDNISSIKGIWIDGTNYEQFFHNLSKGMSKEDAALSTWSGQQASQHGFNHVKVIDIVTDIIPGVMEVVVIFDKKN